MMEQVRITKEAVSEYWEEVERLRMALTVYGTHKAECDYHNWWSHPERHCTCGLQEALDGGEA